MYLIYNLWMHNSMLLFIYFYFLSLMLENLSLSYVLDSPLGHKIHRRSMWKKTRLKIEKIRFCLSLYVHVRELAYVALTLHMQV